MSENLENIKYIAVIQCDIVMERCSGFLCENAFHNRTGGFEEYPNDQNYRVVYLTCGGCCGKAVLRKLHNLTKVASKKAGIEKEEIMVQFASCITKDNYHSSRCPHYGYLKNQVMKEGLAFREDTHISKLAEERRKEGIYRTYD